MTIDQQTWQQTQGALRHLQKCLTALDRIKTIAGEHSPIAALAQAAIQNKPLNAEGTALDG